MIPQVKVGNEHVVNWRLGTNYNDVTINIGTGIVFKWDGSIAHNLIEMTSRDAVTDCMFVGDDSVMLGKVNKCILHTRFDKKNFPA